MLHILCAFCFLGFVLTGLAVVWAQGTDQAARTKAAATTVFICYSLAASWGAGLTQRNLWPFAHWALISGLVQPTTVATRLLAVDVHGVEHQVAYAAWQPFPCDELFAWFTVQFPHLDREAQGRVSRYVLDLIEQARLRVLAGASVGYFRTVLGPFAAPFFHLRPTLWTSSRDLPPAPLVGLRVYEETWNWRERMRVPEHYTRVLKYEYRQP